MNIPPEIAKPIFASYSVICDPVCYVDPLHLRNTSTVDFMLGLKTISVTMDELVVAAYNSTSSCWASGVGAAIGAGPFNVWGAFSCVVPMPSFTGTTRRSPKRRAISMPPVATLLPCLPVVYDRPQLRKCPAPPPPRLPQLLAQQASILSCTHTAIGISTNTIASSASSSSSSLTSGTKASIRVEVAIGALLLLTSVVYYVYARHRLRDRQTAKSSGP